MCIDYKRGAIAGEAYNDIDLEKINISKGFTYQISLKRNIIHNSKKCYSNLMF